MNIARRWFLADKKPAQFELSSDQCEAHIDLVQQLAAICLQSELEIALAPCNISSTLGYMEGTSVEVDISLSRNSDGTHTQTAWGLNLSEYQIYEPNSRYDIFHDQRVMVWLDTALRSEFTTNDYLVGENSRIDLTTENVTVSGRKDNRFLNRANTSLHNGMSEYDYLLFTERVNRFCESYQP